MLAPRTSPIPRPMPHSGGGRSAAIGSVMTGRAVAPGQGVAGDSDLGARTEAPQRAEAAGAAAAGDSCRMTDGRGRIRNGGPPERRALPGKSRTTALGRSIESGTQATCGLTSTSAPPWLPNAIFSAAPPFTTTEASAKNATTPATLSREPIGFLSPGWNL
jgi:hypothetical protein